jgi:hypothetical protein
MLRGKFTAINSTLIKTDFYYETTIVEDGEK